MFHISDEEFEDILNKSLLTLPKEHIKALKNVALIVEDLPDASQIKQFELYGGKTLLGLYEGRPLSQRQGMQKVLPDKITLFKTPIEVNSNSLLELKEQIRHTLWHEIAHYYGLDHDAISSLE
jgi:predicted Zn-dependent protease with MMP-like domain